VRTDRGEVDVEIEAKDSELRTDAFWDSRWICR
jgi:hypothetical protein